MRGLVSFCVFGDDPNDIYYQGALKNAEMYLEFEPRYTCRYYLGRTAAANLAERLQRFSNVSIIETPDPEDQSATFWRFLAVKESRYDFYLFRDVDSRPIERERAAVHEWLESDKQFHVMRDHPYHGAPILAGLWGVKSQGAQWIAGRLPGRLRGNYYQVDQDFLKGNIWRLARRSLMAHVDCVHHFGTEIHPFKVPYTKEGFVGEGFYGDGRPRFPLHNRLLVG